MNKLLSLAIAGTALFAGATSANAALTITGINVVNANAPLASFKMSNHDFDDVRVSPFNVTGNWDGNAVSMLAYCVDLFDYAGTGTFEVVDLLSYLGGDTTRYNRISSLVDTYGATSGSLSQAAMQMAIWELVYETSNNMDVTKNHFDSYWSNSGSLASTANSYLNGAVAGAGSIDPNLKLYVAKNSDKQDLLFYTYQPAVPEPATWAMMILGMGAVGCAMRARRNRTTVSFA